MKSINVLQLIKEQKQKEDRRYKASLAQIAGKANERPVQLSF